MNFKRSKKSSEISESVELAILLTLSGGLMDAYSYLCRGEVFSNAQTGNILLFGVSLATGRWNEALHYALPIFAFTFGIALAVALRNTIETNRHHLRWHQVVLFLEAVILACVAFLPQSANLLATSLASLACGAQAESFRKINGSGAATTMCIGNLRTATQCVCDYHFTRDRNAFQKGLFFYGLIAIFVVGAILGNGLIALLGEKAILASSLMLFVGCLMFAGETQK